MATNNKRAGRSAYIKRNASKKKKPSKLQIILSVIFIATALILSLVEEWHTATQTQSVPEANVAALEIPALTGEEKLINYNGFTVNYNSKAKIPYWVAYSLESYETDGENTRTGKKFRPDKSLPYPQAEESDYRNSGWARGHMAPAADFKWSEEAMDDTFYFTNCCPQDVSLNGGMWSTLEKKTRSYAKKYGRVYVVTGPIIGKKRNGTIGEGGVTVPDSFFKALLVFDGKEYHTIAFVMKNGKQEGNMQKCAMSVNELEKRIGYDLFAALDDDIEERVEASYTLNIWAM
ncbi:MAG: DNA/RNA non-specific endonuclease [Bacteroidales bacterium]|nr:DNA/RNA non-specific endonuclease [Bacteroidales bacterium]